MSGSAKNPDAPPTQLAVEVASLLKDAHEKSDLGSVRSVASALGISHATLARLRNADLAAAGPLTLQRIFDYYGVDAPSGLDLSGESTRGASKVRYVSSYCSWPFCPTCRFSLQGDVWIIRPRPLSVPEVLFAREGGGACRECGNRLRRFCPNPSCGATFEMGAFCPSCGDPYIPRGDLDEDTLQDLRRRSERGTDYIDQVYTYQTPGKRAVQ